MLIPTQQIKEFQKRIVHLKDEPSKPILAYLMLEIAGGQASLFKTDLVHSIRYSFPTSEADCRLLVDEHSLNEFVANCTAEQFALIVSGDDITLDDGAGYTQSFATQPVDDYPKFPERRDTRQFTLDDKILKLLLRASKYVDQRPTNFSYVYSKNNDIFASDNMKFFYYQLESCPVLALRAKACQIIAQHSEVIYEPTENHDFFIADNTVYGFTKSAAQKAPAYEGIMAQLVGKRNSGFSINRERLKQYCESSVSIIGAETTSTMKDNAAGVVLKTENGAMRKQAELKMSVNNKVAPIADFKFEPRNAADALAPLEYEEVFINLDGNNAILYHPDDAGFTGLIAGKNDL